MSASIINSNMAKAVTTQNKPGFDIDWTHSVFLVADSDGGVLFDLDNDELLKLDSIGAEIWKSLSSGIPKSEVAECIAQKYSIDKNRAAEDIDNLIQAAAARNITVSSVQMSTYQKACSPSTPSTSFPWYGKSLNQALPTPKSWTIVRSFFALLLFDFALSLRSLKFVCKLVHHWPVTPSGSDRDPNVAGKVCAAVEVACVWYPKKAVCLQRSAITACLLRSAGIPAHLVIGARVMPLSSHAWVEVDGAVLNDHLKIREVYQTLVAF